MRSLYNHHILAAEKLENIDSNKTELQGTIITSLMWDNVTEIKYNIFGRVWLENTESKWMQTRIIKWNYSSN